MFAKHAFPHRHCASRTRETGQGGRSCPIDATPGPFSANRASAGGPGPHRQIGLQAYLACVCLIAWVPVNQLAAQSEAFRPAFAWSASQPLVSARAVDGWPWHAIKDPSVVQVEGKWHLFATVRGSERSHAIVYVNFDDWQSANEAQQHVLPIHPGYFCAPQVFWFEPQRQWYLICQAASEAWGEPHYRPAYATTRTIGDPDSWTSLQPLYDQPPGKGKAGLDFWVICDSQQAYLFYTSLDGRMWRSSTSLAEFPRGWGTPSVALQDDIFEASHTYRVRGKPLYLTVVEAQHGHGWRYFKAYTATSLDGQWTPLAATKDEAFASLRNVQQADPKWTESISHVELLRAGIDQHLEIDANHLQVVFQGATEAQRRGKAYGEIPWQLGLLTAIEPTTAPAKAP